MSASRCTISSAVTTETEAGVSRMLVATLPPVYNSCATTDRASSSSATSAVTMIGDKR
ncbi:hypothetical protein [Loktanella fryxellensis]|uniref:hypothetical protein n=1 Tax=Loktanella fryxellensis TaxID=245187 RepID=UPI001FDF2D1A|nr:hypothetical protein [Loktanella fryxellensis]